MSNTAQPVRPAVPKVLQAERLSGLRQKFVIAVLLQFNTGHITSPLCDFVSWPKMGGNYISFIELLERSNKLT